MFAMLRGFGSGDFRDMCKALSHINKRIAGDEAINQRPNHKSLIVPC